LEAGMSDLLFSDAALNQHRILVVDDDTAILETLREGLSLWGYLCETAVDAASALQIIDKKYLHSVIVDINLTDMNGLDLVEKIKKLFPNIVVIIMTGFIDNFSYEDAMQAGASDFIKKPFSVKELIARIEHAKKHETLYRISLHDDLTGLYNRRGFFTLTEYLLRKAKRDRDSLFMLYADLDDLKDINDTLGHQKGDWALIDTANILRDTFRNSDIIARIGGDEFVVIPIGKRGDNVELIVNRLQLAVELDNKKGNREYTLSISTGIAFFDSRYSCTIDEILAQADKSMYQAKRNRQLIL
jgi:two-component system, cell cycle response regulator